MSVLSEQRRTNRIKRLAWVFRLAICSDVLLLRCARANAKNNKRS